MKHGMDDMMSERMKWLPSSQKSVYFGFIPLSLSTVNSHSTTHMLSVEEVMISTVHDPLFIDSDSSNDIGRM